ncbi:MAG: hypothetical protein P8N57_07340 [Flavobacteriaceae bacterium]|nr:hypothetical protein [Flavobacteriaceae bacterium]
MKFYKISEFLYVVIAAISLIEVITLWDIQRDKAYLFFGFAALSIFMFLFRRKYRKKFKNR